MSRVLALVFEEAGGRAMRDGARRRLILFDIKER